jgi:hypothetical protein
MEISEPALPKNLWPIRDGIVEHVLTGAPLPQDYGLLHQWLEGAGWDALTNGMGDDEMAINLAFLSMSFADSELSSYEDIDEERICDVDRITFARDLIARTVDECDGYLNPSVHCYKMVREDGRSAVVACTIEIHGQGGPVANWCGFYSSEEDFLKTVKGPGLVLWKDIENLEDSELLSLWHVEKRKPAKRKKQSP